jgi:hypothetical protein
LVGIGAAITLDVTKANTATTNPAAEVNGDLNISSSYF